MSDCLTCTLHLAYNTHGDVGLLTKKLVAFSVTHPTGRDTLTLVAFTCSFLYVNNPYHFKGNPMPHVDTCCYHLLLSLSHTQLVETPVGDLTFDTLMLTPERCSKHRQCRHKRVWCVHSMYTHAMHSTYTHHSTYTNALHCVRVCHSHKQMAEGEVEAQGR